MERHWADDDNVALLTDLYQLTMLQAYWRESMFEEAVFSLFVRKLPQERNYLLACGLDDALALLESFHFSETSLAYLKTRETFSPDFLDWLSRLRFRGSVYAVPEGTPVFEQEPILEVVASLPEAQIVETVVMNQVHLQTVLASKARRVVEAASERTVVDFGLRRMHGADAGIKSARAFFVAGVDATSNVLAGALYGVPIAGTMAHSYIQAHESELVAFRRFSELYPDTILLVDTYDTEQGVENVVRLAKELGPSFRVRGVRLDSGDLGALAKRSREILDAAGLSDVTLFASGSLDEHEIARLVREAPSIRGFGVGTRMGVSTDVPALDMAYKMTAYAKKGRLKLSTGKRILPGRKQIFRVEEGHRATKDILAREGETLGGRPLIVKVMDNGKRTPLHVRELVAIRSRAEEEIGRLPAEIRALTPADPRYPVEPSDALLSFQREVASEVSRRADPTSRR